jgi:hypothetical protein
MINYFGRVDWELVFGVIIVRCLKIYTSALQDWWGEIRGNAAGLEKTASCAAPDQHAMAYRARCSVTNVRIPSLIYGNTAATFRAPSGGKIAGEKTVDRTLRQHLGLKPCKTEQNGSAATLFYQ